MTLKNVFVFSIRFVPYLLWLIGLLLALLSHLLGEYPNHHHIHLSTFKSPSFERPSQLSQFNFLCQLSLFSLPTILVLHLLQFKTDFGAIPKQHVNHGLVIWARGARRYSLVDQMERVHIPPSYFPFKDFGYSL